MTAQFEFDVAVIGAGIAGCSAAAELARHCRVLLLEMERSPASHATGRSAAYFAPAYGNAVVRSMTAASADFYHSPGDFSPVPLLRPRPAMFVAQHGQQDSLNAMFAEIDGIGRITAAAAKDRVSRLREDRLAGALLDTKGGDLDVDAIVQGYLRQFRSLGGELRTGTPVAGIAKTSGGWRIDAADVVVPYVVNAAGAWADEVAMRAGVKPLGLVPKRRTAFLVRVPGEYAHDDWPLVIDVDEQFYFKPDAGLLLMSPADETPTAPCDAHPDDFDIAVAVDRIQAVLDIEVRTVESSWAGLRTFAADKTFVVGESFEAPGFFWLAGQGGYGVQTAPAMARTISHLVLGTPLPAGLDDATLAAMHPARNMKPA